MLSKKQFLAVAGVVCVVVASLTVLVYAAWDPQDMANYMFNIGRHKIYQTNWILYNEIGPKMGQGLVGEWNNGSTTTNPGFAKVFIQYLVPTNNPKKFSLYVNLEEMQNGDEIVIFVIVDTDGDDIYEEMEDTPTRRFRWEFQDAQYGKYGKLIIDELPIATKLQALALQNAGPARTISFHYIIEEM